MENNFTPNEAQRKAIEFPIDRPLKVVAGAGTGKTAVLTKRFVRIVEKHAVMPSRILALTFTKKAAAEMQRRIVRELFRKKLLSRSEAPLMLWIGSFHSIALRLLRQHALVAGLDPSFGNINEVEQQLLLASVVTDFLNKKLGAYVEDAYTEGAPAEGPHVEDAHADAGEFESLMIERVDDFIRNASGVVNRLKGQIVDLDTYGNILSSALDDDYRAIEGNLREMVDNELAHAKKRKAARKHLESLPAAKAHERLLLDAVQKIRTAYARELEKRDKLDFNDLISYACRLAEAEPSVKARFDYILVDEFQDTDGAQLRLLKALSDDLKNVTVVCDRKQSIYEWREARPENITDFPGESIFLDENYRSVGEILDSAHFFISRTMESEKPLKPALDGGRGRAGEPRVRLFRASCGEEEADYVASEIARLSEECKPGEIAILMRSVRASGHIENALRARGIRHTVGGGKGFHDLSETKDLLALLRLIENPFDDISMARILQSPIVGLGDAALYALRRPGDNSSVAGLFDSLHESDRVLEDADPRVRARAAMCVKAIGELSRERWSLTTGEIVSEALARTNYIKYLTCIEGARGPRFSNVSRFYKSAALFEERNPAANLADFITYMETTMAGDSGPSAVAHPEGAVRIMTVHQAKGLEFPVVFVMNLRMGGSGLPLKYRGGGFGYNERFGVFAAKLPDGKSLVRYKGGGGVGVKETLKAGQFNEENRIMYVAMTRAERLLYLTTPQPDVEDDFFSRMEEYAGGDGAKSTEIIHSFESLSGTSDDGGADDAAASEEEIRLEAQAAVERIRREPATAMGAERTTVRLSYSRLALFRQCPAKYALRHVYNLPIAPHEGGQDETYRNIGAFTLGNLMHDALMHFHRRRRKDSPSDAVEILENLASTLPPAVVSAARNMLDKYLRHSLAKIQTLHEEKEFHWKIAGDAIDIVFEGKVDRVHRDDNGLLTIVDYKTGERYAESHALQLGMYRLAMEEALGEEDLRTSNYYLSTGEEVECSFSAEELRGIRDGIIEDACKIAARDFRISERDERGYSGCGDCGYNAFCKYRPETAEP